MLEEYILNNKNTNQTNQRLASRWNIHQALKISHSIFANIYRNFRDFGCVTKPPRKQSTVRTPENIERVREIASAHADADEDVGSRRIALEAGLSHTTTWRILKKNLKWHPYHLKLVHELNEDDFDRRVEFSERFLAMDEEDPEWKNNILWSDEAIFSLSDTVNRHNCVYWAPTNPNRVIERNRQGSQSVMVWAGISSNRCIGPFFFNEHVAGHSYLAMLRDQVLPIVEDWDEFPHLVFQQDGAPAHYARDVRSFLDDSFHYWLGRRGTYEWPARSPDLTPADFFLWGHLKDRVFRVRPRSVADLQTRITEEFNAIPQEMIRAACQSLPERYQLCIDLDGMQLKLAE